MLAKHIKHKLLDNRQALRDTLLTTTWPIRPMDAGIGVWQICYAYFGALYKQIPLFLVFAIRPDYPERRKTALPRRGVAVQDVKRVQPDGISMVALLRPHLLRAALGSWMIESYTLGGDVIGGIIAPRLNAGIGADHGFFTVHAGKTQRRRLRFKNAMSGLACSSERLRT